MVCLFVRYMFLVIRLRRNFNELLYATLEKLCELFNQKIKYIKFSQKLVKPVCEAADITLVYVRS